MGDLTTGAFGTVSEPFMTSARSFVDVAHPDVARLLALLVVGVMVVPWLSRYLPWRAGRLAYVCAAHKAIRRGDMTEVAMERALATRALYRLSYPELLEHTTGTGWATLRRANTRSGQGRAGERRVALTGS